MLVVIASVRHGSRLIVLLRVDLDMATAPGVLARIDQLVADEVPRRLVVDLARVGFMDSSGLALLADLSAQGRRLGFPVLLVGLTVQHRRLVDVCRMSHLFAAS